MKPKLYQYAACPFCSKVAALLTYKKVDYETIEVNPLNNKEIAFSKEYTKVPIYIDSKGQQVNDSAQIMKHVDREFPEPLVFKTNSPEKEEEEKWLAWSENYVQALPTLIYENFFKSLKAFHYITRVGNFSWFSRRMVKYSGALAMTLVAKKLKAKLNIQDPKALLTQKIQEWTQGLNNKDWMGGLAPNASDIAVFGISRIVHELPAGKALKENPKFSQWMNRMAERTGLSIKIIPSSKKS